MAQTWLNKLGYKYKNLCKYIFIDGYKRSNVIKDYANFLKLIKNLKPYIVEFEKEEIIKAKVYLDNYIVKD